MRAKESNREGERMKEIERNREGEGMKEIDKDRGKKGRRQSKRVCVVNRKKVRAKYREVRE